MQVFEIISEVVKPRPPGPIPPGMKWNGTMWVPITPPKKPETSSDTSKDKPSKKPKRERKPIPFDKNWKKNKPATKPKGFDGMVYRWQNRKSNYEEYLQRYVPKWANRWSVFLKWLLRITQVVEPTYQMIRQLGQAEKDYLESVSPFNSFEEAELEGAPISQDEADKIDTALYNETRNWIVGEYMGKFGVIVAAQGLAYILRALVWGKLIKNLFLFIGAPLTFWTSAVAAVGTEVAIVATIKWLESPEGRKWWEAKIEDEILLLGVMGDSAWQAAKAGITAFFTDQPIQSSKDELLQRRRESRNPDGTKEKDPSGQGTQDNKLRDTPPPSQSAVQYPSNIRTWVNGGWAVGGHPVTDGRGFLKPGIEHVIAVQGARRLAQIKKLPDPLADLPAAPGQKHPGPYVD